MIRALHLTSAVIALAVPLMCGAQSATVPTIPGMPPDVREAAQSIDGEKIRAHVRFLSSDLLEGRGPGLRGSELAAEYIATQFQLSGLQPAGDKGTYFQKVSLMAVHTVEDQTNFAFIPQSGAKISEPISLKYGEDIVTKDETGEAQADIDAPIVFVGYGIDAPEYHWNDYVGVDVKGKVLLVIVNEPPSEDEKFFAGKALTYYGRWTYKYEEAARRGALGVLIIHRRDLASYGWEVVRNSQAIEKSYLQNDPLATLKAASWVQLDVARKLLSAAGMDIDQAIDSAGKPGFRAVELPVHLKAHITSAVRKYESSNVVAFVPGSKDEKQAVLFTAHYDHLGIDPNAQGDKIYNGAIDNATGCGILLEMARAYSQVKLLHPVYFSAVTAEEQGLLGSQYLGMHPPIPAKDFSLDLNYDALAPLGNPLALEIGGAERTTFYPVVEKTAQIFHLAIQPDQFPGAGHYYRSDHFSLARVGIPSFSVDEGTLYEGHPVDWGEEQAKEYTANHYHQPSDEYNPSWDFRGLAKMAQFGFILGWEASVAGHEQGWQAGDEFEKVRKQTMVGNKSE
jgi:Zn-dependent M28 family amino/carboxypeptidase